MKRIKGTGGVRDPAHTIAMILNFVQRLGTLPHRMATNVLSINSKELGRPESESTVRGMKKAYILLGSNLGLCNNGIYSN